mgnify:CR=1 FL=1
MFRVHILHTFNLTTQLITELVQDILGAECVTIALLFASKFKQLRRHRQTGSKQITINTVTRGKSCANLVHECHISWLHANLSETRHEFVSSVRPFGLVPSRATNAMCEYIVKSSQAKYAASPKSVQQHHP